MAAGLGVLLAVLGPRPLFAQSTCDWYARTALRQQQENVTRKCGFAGLAWHADLSAHLAWCQGVPPEQWKAEAQKREHDLAACGKR